MKIKQNSEDNLQLAVKKYLDLAYPKVLYKFNYLCGIKLNIGQAARAKTMGEGKGFPDLFIYEARGDFHGLAIELKREGTRLRKRDGHWASEHIFNQQGIIELLKACGYCAAFAVGFDETRTIIDNYLRG